MMLFPPVYLGRNRWPAVFPRKNVSQDADDALDELIEKDSSCEKPEHELAVAAKPAQRFDLKIKVGSWRFCRICRLDVEKRQRDERK